MTLLQLTLWIRTILKDSKGLLCSIRTHFYQKSSNKRRRLRQNKSRQICRTIQSASGQANFKFRTRCIWSTFRDYSRYSALAFIRIFDQNVCLFEILQSKLVSFAKTSKRTSFNLPPVTCQTELFRESIPRRLAVPTWSNKWNNSPLI